MRSRFDKISDFFPPSVATKKFYTQKLIKFNISRNSRGKSLLLVNCGFLFILPIKVDEIKVWDKRAFNSLINEHFNGRLMSFTKLNRGVFVELPFKGFLGKIFKCDWWINWRFVGFVCWDSEVCKETWLLRKSKLDLKIKWTRLVDPPKTSNKKLNDLGSKPDKKIPQGHLTCFFFSRSSWTTIYSNWTQIF